MGAWASKPVVGRHTYNNVAKSLQDIHVNFGLAAMLLVRRRTTEAILLRLSSTYRYYIQSATRFIVATFIE